MENLKILFHLIVIWILVFIAYILYIWLYNNLTVRLNRIDEWLDNIQTLTNYIEELKKEWIEFHIKNLD